MPRRSTFDPVPPSEPYEQQLKEAALLVKARLTREAHPEGEWVGGVWLPSKSERQACCNEVAPPEPIRGRQQTLESHCRTLLHVAYLKEVGVEDLRRKWRELGFRARPFRSKDQDGSSDDARGERRGELIPWLRKFHDQLTTMASEIEEFLERSASAGTSPKSSDVEGGQLSLEVGTQALDARLHLPVGKRDKERWMRQARKEGFDLSQWIRRILNQIQGPLPGGVQEDRPLNDSLELRVNSKDKERWERSAREDGLGIVQWVRRVLNAAAQHPRGQQGE